MNERILNLHNCLILTRNNLPLSSSFLLFINLLLYISLLESTPSFSSIFLSSSFLLPSSLSSYIPIFHLFLPPPTSPSPPFLFLFSTHLTKYLTIYRFSGYVTFGRRPFR